MNGLFFERQSKYSVRIEYQLESQNGFIRFNDLVDYKYGDLVKIKGTKRLCREPRNPGMFNECHWWYRNGIDYQLDVSSHQLIKPSEKGWGLMFLSNLNDHLYKRLETYFNHHAPMVYTILFGNRIDRLSNEIKSHFLNIGIIHILVVSGAQISIISLSIILITRLLKIPFLISFFIIIFMQLVYLLITGLDPSILRAVVMTNLILFHRFYLIIAYPFWVYLLVAAIVVILVIPKALLFPGFWYSFFITFGLIRFTPQFSQHILGPKYFVQYVIANLIAVIFSIPIQLFQNQLILPMSFIANLWITWMSILILFLGISVLIFDLFFLYLLIVLHSGYDFFRCDDHGFRATSSYSVTDS